MPKTPTNDLLDQYLADLEASRPDTHDLVPERDEDDLPSPDEPCRSCGRMPDHHPSCPRLNERSI